jgi:hypothetical protein
LGMSTPRAAASEETTIFTPPERNYGSPGKTA